MVNIAVAGIQMDIIPRDREKNVEYALRRITEAAESGAGLICLPEMFTTGFDYEYMTEHAESMEGDTVSRLAESAKRLGVYIVGGSIPELEKGKIYNTAVLVGPSGDVIGKYRKIHLFPLMAEDTYLQQGENIPVFDTEIGKIGIMICYDIRFPELARTLALSGAEILVIPAEFPYPRIDHWRCLLQARAIENQLYVFAVNRVGRDSAGIFFGHTALYDPWGDILAGSGDRESLVTGRIDTGKVHAVRKSIPVFRDRRPGLYC